MKFENQFPQFVHGKSGLPMNSITMAKIDPLYEEKILRVYPNIKTWAYYVRHGGDVIRCCECNSVVPRGGMFECRIPYCDKCWGIHGKRIHAERRAAAFDPSQLARAREKYQRKLKENPDLKRASLKKARQTNLERYGVDHPQKSKVVKEKTRKTVEERYGGFLLASPIIAERIRNTNLEKYGVDNPTKNPEIFSKVRDTMYRRYGGFTGESTILSERVAASSMERYGVPHPFMSERNEERRRESCRAFAESIKLAKYDTLLKIISREGRLRAALSSKRFLRKYRDFREEIVEACGKFGIEIANYISSPEKLVGDFVNSLGFSHKKDRRVLGDRREIDIMIDDTKVGIEVNGNYYHSYNPYSDVGISDKNYHMTKSILANEAGVLLLQFWEDEILNKWEIVTSIIKNSLGLSKKIPARKCTVGEIPFSEAKRFFDENHLNGSTRAKKSIGLYHEGVLVSAMSFSKTRFERSSGGWELVRFCTLRDHVVVGGGSKIIDHFFQSTQECDALISYADRMMGNGGSYERMGFEYISDVAPGYFWCWGGGTRESRQKFQKHKLVKILKDFDPDLSESENLYRNGFRKLHNAGYRKFSKRNPYAES